MDWFLYCSDLRHERVNHYKEFYYILLHIQMQPQNVFCEKKLFLKIL